MQPPSSGNARRTTGTTRLTDGVQHGRERVRLRREQRLRAAARAACRGNRDSSERLGDPLVDRRRGYHGRGRVKVVVRAVRRRVAAPDCDVVSVRDAARSSALRLRLREPRGQHALRVHELEAREAARS